jgi:hypothetical protein
MMSLGVWEEMWKRVFHEELGLESISPGGMSLALRKRFEYARGRVAGHEVVVAFDDEVDGAVSYRKYRDELEGLLGVPVVFFLPKLAPWQKSRMIQQGVGHATLGGHGYFPRFYIHVGVREGAGFVREEEEKEYLSPVAQVLVIRQILVGDVHGESFSVLKGRLGYSAMSLSKARGELLRKGLCELEGVATRSKMVFELTGKELWDRALPFMRTPVMRTHYLAYEGDLGALVEELGLTLAGESALAEMSLMSAPPVPCYAVGKQRIRQVLSSPKVRAVPRDEAMLEVQQWRYWGVVPGERAVDRLSLRLSLGDEARLVQALRLEVDSGQ